MTPIVLLLLALLAPALAGDAEALIRAGKVDAAVPVAEKEAKAAPRDIDAQERWIDLMLAVGLPGPMQTWYAEQVRQHPTDANAHYLVGRAALSAEDSLAAYERALSLDPDHARSYMGLGALDRVSGKLRDAAEEYQRALRLDPKLAEAWGGLLATSLASGDPKAVLAVARAAITAVPDQPEGWLALVAVAPDEAPTAIREAARRIPWDARIQAALADQLLIEGQARPALDAARKARSLDPTSKEAILAELQAKAMAAGTIDAVGHKALLDARRLQDREPEAARAVWDSLVVRYPRCSLPLLGRAGSRARTDPAGQRADLEAALKLDPQNDEVAASLGLLLAASGETKAALPLLDRAAAARPLDAPLAVADARAHAKAGDVDAALQRIVGAEDAFPLDLEIAITHVAILSQAGRHDEALAAARSALSRLPDVRMELTVAAASVAAERWVDAAEIYESLGKRTNKPAFLETAARLRLRAATKATP